jgi:hypothetical protein
MTGKLALAKKTSAVLLVLGLLLEFNEAAKSDTEVAKLRLQTQQAEASIATLESRAASAQKDAANARLETEKLRSEMGGRTLSSAKFEQLVSMLKAHPGTVTLWSEQGDEEAFEFKNQLQSAFSKAGWKASLADEQDVGFLGTLWGIVVVWSGKRPESNMMLAEFCGALATLGLRFDIEAPKDINVTDNFGDLYVFVGTKPTSLQ